MAPTGSIEAAGRGPTGGAASAVSPEIRRAAQEFESVFVAQILSQLDLGLAGPGAQAGAGESPFASMLRDEYAKIISRSGGIGLADAVMRELVSLQEVA